MNNKKSFYTLIIFFLIQTTFISCSSNDDNEGQNNENQRVLQIEKLDGTLFADGDVIVFNEIGTDDIRSDQGKLKYNLRNVGDQHISVLVEVMDIRGTDGSLFTFCMQPLCIFDVAVGGIYPGGGSIIQPGAVNSDDDYFINRDAGNGTSTIEYDFRFFVTDNNGNQTDDLTITYKYEPAD